MPFVSRLLVYPIKSFDAHEVASAALLPSGALAHDRSYALVDADGDVVTGKRHAAVHQLKASFDLSLGTVRLHDRRETPLPDAIFALRADRTKLEQWLSTFFGMPVSLREDREMGFPDDPLSPGPTMISTASLRAIGEWFELPIENVRARLRTNIEIDDAPAFWEDQLLGADESPLGFMLGSVRFLGVNPCARCIVPTRDPLSGARDPGFTHRFSEQRRATLPDWTPRGRFDHFYRAALNTRIGAWRSGAAIAVGDQATFEMTTA